MADRSAAAMEGHPSQVHPEGAGGGGVKQPGQDAVAGGPAKERNTLNLVRLLSEAG